MAMGSTRVDKFGLLGWFAGGVGCDPLAERPAVRRLDMVDRHPEPEEDADLVESRFREGVVLPLVLVDGPLGVRRPTVSRGSTVSESRISENLSRFGLLNVESSAKAASMLSGVGSVVFAPGGDGELTTLADEEDAGIERKDSEEG